MEKKNHFKKIMLDTCIYYTAVTFFVLFLYFLINADLSRGVHPVSLILFLPFSFCFAAANYYFKHARSGTALKVFLHYTLTLGGTWLFLFLPNKAKGQSASGAFILFVALSVLYAIVMTVILVIRSRYNRVTRDESDYVSVYNKKDE